MLFVVAALADRRHIRDIPRFANVATAEMIVVRRYVWSTNALRGSNRMSRRTEPVEDHREQEGRSRRLSMPSMEADAARGDPRRANAGSFC